MRTEFNVDTSFASASALILVVSGSLLSSAARAELWNPLDAIPKPNAIIGLDSSVTMGITPGCDDCHAPGSSGTKLEIVKTSINATLPLFQDHFVFGGFEYSGCDFAKIDARAVPPNPSDPDGSFTALQDMIGAAQHCMTRERYFPSMQGPVSTGFATPGGAGDLGIIEALFIHGALANDGFDPMAAWRTKQCGSASVGNPCAWWPPKPPDVDPPDPPPVHCPCADASCHIRTEGNVWVMAGGCAGEGDDMYDGSRFMGTCDNPNGCCIWVPCVNGMCYAYLSENEWNPLCDQQPPPNPPYDPYPCWGVEGTPVSWPDINPGPPPGCILQNPDYPYYINAPVCVDDPTDPDNWCISHHILCAGGQTLDTQLELQAALADYRFPRWYQRTLTREMVEDEFCRPLRDAVRTVRGKMMACSGGPLVEYPDPDAADFCNPDLLKDTICGAQSPFFGTCVCDDSDPACSNLDAVDSACGTPLDFKARQQVAVCETYHPDYLRTYYLNQPDNRVAGGCRENMSMLFTDGYGGQSAGVAAEAAKARSYYETEDAESNMFVFRVSNVFESEADALSQALGQGPTAFDATDLPNIQASMARVLNRAYRGVYSGSSPASGVFSANVAIHSFTVPGGGSMPPGDAYLGFPSRISFYRVDHNGALVDPPLFETDWASSVSASSSCGPTNIGGTDVAMLGPDGTFRTGVSRAVSIPADSIDRDGDGQPDPHPPLTWGKSYSIGSTQPVVVEGPRDALTAPYQDYAAVAARPRTIYVMSNGYLLGYYAGTRNDIVSLYGDQKVSYGYTVDSSAGAEILRYRPTWLQDPRVDYQYALNDLIQQPILTGELVAQEMVFDAGTSDAKAHTVLVGMQGKTGPGVFSLDITDPCSPSVLGEWTLPGPTDRASADPVLGLVLDGAQRRPAVLTTGGLGGSPSIYAFDIRSGSLISSLGLPAGSYPSAPACLDVTGEARVTHCYVLSEAGRLVRVALGESGFVSATDITPAGTIGPRYSTSPVAFFGVNGEVNLIFGSGNFEDFDKPDAENFLFKVVDRGSTAATMPTTPADLTSACKESESGKIALAPGERIISKPLVADELVAWTAFMPTTSDCLAGRTSLYAMDFETCDNLLVPANGSPPAPLDVGEGFATTPVLHEVSKSLIVAPSAAPTGGQVESVGARLPGGGRLAKKVFYRPWADTR
ncbi:MAG: hypothetical protein IPK13_11225 [Deltaproteobacteria bacterium]|nr:hypothetical protein [Deltaproteobacteria bacterium]